MVEHEYTLDELNRGSPLSQKLVAIHEVLKRRLRLVDRIAVVVYDAKTDLLKTFLHSSGPDDPLSHYQNRLSDAPSLLEVKESRRPRVIGDINAFSGGTHEHTRRIAVQGYRSSYTLPMYMSGTFFGFVFFNSYLKNPFRANTLHVLDLFGHLVSLVVSTELANIRTLLSSVKVAKDFTYHRDIETGAHLDRMSRYARLIAKELAPQHGFDDEHIENIFLFSPLHDIGKISIPDAILHKPTALTPQEFEIMKTHTSKGREIIDDIMQDFRLEAMAHIDMLRNIAEYHHERMGGQGYPKGLAGAAIPIEARIVAVADVFDALTSQRPYKHAWSNDEAYAALGHLAGPHLDPDCVAPMIKLRAKVEDIQAQFRETVFA